MWSGIAGNSWLYTLFHMVNTSFQRLVLMKNRIIFFLFCFFVIGVGFYFQSPFFFHAGLILFTTFGPNALLPEEKSESAYFLLGLLFIATWFANFEIIAQWYSSPDLLWRFIGALPIFAMIYLGIKQND